MHVNNLLSISCNPFTLEIDMVCKLFAFFKIYFANLISHCRPKKSRIVQVLRYNERHCGTNLGFFQITSFENASFRIASFDSYLKYKTHKIKLIIENVIRKK